MYSSAISDGVYNFNNIRTELKKFPKDIFEFRLVFIPINIKNKQWALVVYDVESQSIYYRDSLNAHAWNEEVIENSKKLLIGLTQSNVKTQTNLKT